MTDKSDDQDYRVLHGYLKAHFAPQFFMAALDRLIARAGVRHEAFATTPVRERLSSERIKSLVKQGKTQMEIAVICSVSVRKLSKFMQEQEIRPSYNGCGKHENNIVSHRRIAIEAMRDDPVFPVPVKVITAAYASIR